MTISVWQEKAERAQAKLAKVRETLSSAVVQGRRDGATVLGGLLAGAARGAAEASGKDYSIPGPNKMKIPPELPVGVLVLAAAYSGKTEVTPELHGFGSGILAYSAGRETENWMKARGSKLPGAAQ